MTWRHDSYLNKDMTSNVQNNIKKPLRAYIQRAYCKVHLQEYESALADYKTAMLLNPNDPVTYLNAGHTLCKLNSENTDTTYFDRAIELDSNMHEAYFMRGLANSYADLYELAVEDLTKAIDIEPSWVGYYLVRGNVYKRLKRYDKALSDYKKIKELEPNSKDVDEKINYCEKRLSITLVANN